ncbi:MAG: MCP four helix bundle domain-containing protein [Candidatus Krumholzibacteria bacterium]|nr:MCP four helix bundle domain-containing protein [Candidatus Krumholzibacteria bacterium]
MHFRDLKIGTKAAIGYGLIMVIFAGVNLFSVLRMNALKNQINEVATRRLTSAIAIADINNNISLLRTNQLQHAFATSDERKSEQAEIMIELIELIEQNQDTYGPLITYAEERRLYSEFEQKWERYLELGYQFLELSLGNQNQKAIDLLNDEAQTVFADVSRTLQQLIKVNQTASLEAAIRAEEMFRGTRRTIQILLVVMILVSVLLAHRLVRLITVPVGKLVNAAETVTRGDVEVRLDVLSKDEIGHLSHSFNEMTASLRAARDQIHKQQADLQKTNEELEKKTHNLEQALQQLQEAQQQLVMKEKMASLGDLVAGVAHEINNPVGAIHSAADTSTRSMKRLGEALDKCKDIEELRQDRGFIQALQILKNNNAISYTASDRITKIVKSLKNFARLDESELQNADLHEGLDSTLTLLEHRLKNRVEVRKNYGKIPLIACHPNQLNQVFMNVLSNAEQSIDDKGTISIESSEHDGKVVIRITDTGRGIKKEQISRIFDPGYTTKGVGVGTGLGLSISYNIVKNHGGDIVIDSVVGKGTTVSIVLPIRQAVT